MKNRKAVKPSFKCRDCKHHYGDHEVGFDGKFFLTKCPFKKWSVFLKDDACENFLRS